MSDAERISAIRTRLNASTRGYWVPSKKQVLSPGVKDVVCNCVGHIHSGYYGDHEQALKDAEFIAHAHQDVRWLLDQLDMKNEEDNAGDSVH